MTARIPGDGEVRLGPVSLPRGRQVVPRNGAPVAWVTEDAVPGAGQVWAALWELHPVTGLVPVLLDPRDNPADFFFAGAADPGAIERVSAARFLASMWPEADGAAGAPPGGNSGLAPAESVRLPAATLAAALGSFEPAHIGLVPASRSADVPAAVGWLAFHGLEGVPNGVWIGSVLRSFADRFGTRLLKIGPGAEIRLLVERPPRTLEAARRVAAEHVAFADEHAGFGQLSVSQLATVLMNAPVWVFWWN